MPDPPAGAGPSAPPPVAVAVAAPAPVGSAPTSTSRRPRLPSHSSSSHKSFRLPADLERFLARYPHPVFALRASALYDALVAGRESRVLHPVDLAGAASAPVPSQAQSRGESTAGRHRATKTQPGLSSRDQYEGGVESDDTPTLSPAEQGDAAPSRRVSSAEALHSDSGENESSTSPSDAPSPADSSPAPSPTSSPAPTPVGFGQSGPSPVQGSFPPRSVVSSVAGSHLSRAYSAQSAMGQRRAADAGTDPRAHARAERILASAFDSPTQSGPGSRHTPRGSYLEGGAQKSHDPSRTAEGAVKAMYEQREKREKDDLEEEVATAEREQGFDAERRIREQGELESRDRWSNRGKEGSSHDGQEERSDSGEEGEDDEDEEDAGALGGRGVGIKALLTPVWRNGKWRELMAIREDAKTRSASGKTDKTDKERSTGVFDKATAHATPSRTSPQYGQNHDDGEELELLTLLSRADAQECLAMLTNVVEHLHPKAPSKEARQERTPLAQLDHTVLLELQFPETSIYRHPPGSSFQHRHTLADSRAPPSHAEHGGSSSSSSTGSSWHSTNSGLGASASGAPPPAPLLSHNPPSDRDLLVYAANPYATGSPPALGTEPPGAHAPVQRGGAPAANQNPAVPAQHRGVQQVADMLRPFLQIVATLQPESDLVVCTTILANMPLPVTLTGSGEKEDKDEVRRERREARTRVDSRKTRERESREAAETAAYAVRQQADQQGVRDLRSRPRSSSAAKLDIPSAPSRAPLQSPSFRSTSPFPGGYRPSRPPLSQRSTSYSSISGASSSGSTVVGPSTSAQPMPKTSSPREPQQERPTYGTGSLLDGVTSEARQAMLLPHPNDNVPTPFEAGTHTGVSVGIPTFAPEQPTSPAPPTSPRGSSRDSSESRSSGSSQRLGENLSARPPSPQPPSHHVQPLQGPTRGAPPQTPSVSDEIKELWVDLSEHGRENGLPRGFVQEKESRAAARRRTAASEGGSDGRQCEPRDSDNNIRERERQRKAKKRDKEWKREQAERERGREGLGDLLELDEPPDGGAESGDSEGERTSGTDDEAYADVLGFDEEDEGADHDEMDRLRARTRTGSTSSAGSAHEREGAAAEARRAQDQQERDEREQREKRERRRVKEDAEDREDRTAEQRRARQVEREEQRREPDEKRLEVPAAARLSSGDTRSATGTHSSRALSTASSGAAAVTVGLAGGSGLTIHEGSLASDVYDHAAPTYSYGDPFLDTVAQTPCGRTILSVDWAATALGDIRGWGAELRSHVMAMLASPFHTALWYSVDNVLLYNDAYARLLGPAKHPSSMGKSGAEGWSEVWDVLGPLAGQVFMGKTISISDHCNCIMRNGMLEETYHSWAYITLRDAQARIIGYQNPSFETTARVIAERRLGTLRELSQLTQLARTTKDFCAKALRALSSNPLDVPFAILYTCEAMPIPPGRRTKGDASTDSDATRMQGSRSSDSGGGRHSAGRTSGDKNGTNTTGPDLSTVARLRLVLQGSIGVPKDHASAVDEVNVLLDTAAMQDGPERSSASSVSSASGTNSTNEDNSSSTVWPFIEALQTRKPVFISELGDRTKGFERRGWPDKVHRAVVMPIITEGSALPKALLIVGLNPRRPFNAVMAQFFNLVGRTLSTGLLGIEVAEEQARKSRELSELNDARQAFFANISHELRTPLTLILGPLEDVLTSKTAALDNEDRDRLEVVQRNAHRLLNMVNTLLDFSRLESGKMSTRYRPTLLGPRTADLAGLFRSAVERGGIDYQVQIDEDKWAVKVPFYLSDEMYEKVVFNLIGNAFKYTISGHITIKVAFTSQEGILSIEDTGVGIADTDLESIFDRFHRVDSAARSFEGTGIGLSLVLELVKTLGGTITVDSKLGKGSKFTVRLPRGHAHLDPETVDPEPYESVNLPPRAAQSLAIINDASSWRVDSQPKSNLGQSSAATHKMLVGSSGRRASESETLPSVFNLEKSETVCLVVDDNAQLRSFIGNTLSKSFTVVEKGNGEEALEYILAHPEVSIVVTDLAMPVMGGRELLAALRNNPETSLVPVIFLSAQAGAEARVDALLLGADDYIVKPFQARELLARVNVHLQLGHMRKELERRVTERTAALIESEKKLKELAEQHQTLALVSPVGIFQCDTKGTMVFTNPRYLEITQHPPGVPFEQIEVDLHPDDVERVRELWHQAISNWRPDKGVSTFEYRYKAGNWAQLEVRSFDKGFIGSITDISHQKEVEAFHIREVEQRAHEAEENRRNTEMFLDMSSHELRNPLSGVWQNAEVVGGSLEKFVEFLEELRAQPETALDHVAVEELYNEMLENVDAIESIMLCASHQGRIADDILNVSKLNMGLLSINIAPFDLVTAVREVVKTFEAQSHQQQITLAVEKGASLAALNGDWIVADSGRIKQVTYNFLTNALKYTVDSSRKSVTVHIGVYAGPPPTPANAMRIATPNQSFEPPENCVWCVVGVQDSGKGLSAEQLKLLFARFSQANPKSDQYGGSGLGLYVSKKLVELHRGFIEVESELGRGSTFRFAIPAPRSARPAEDETRLSAPKTLLGGGKRSKRPTSSSGRPALTSLSSSSSSTSRSGLAPMHILVVEDNLINQKVMMRQLRTQGFQVTLAGDGQQALDILADDAKRTAGAVEHASAPTSPVGDEPAQTHNPIRCVLMDIEMPVLDGMSAVRELRRREKAGELSRRYPVCAVTGNAREGQKRDCLTAGFDDVATKPYRLAELLQQISTLTGLPLPAPK